MYLVGFGTETPVGRSMGSGLVLNGEVGCGERWLGFNDSDVSGSGLGMCVLGLKLLALLPLV